MRTKQGENAIIITLVFAIIFCMGMGYSYVTNELSGNSGNKQYQVQVQNVGVDIPSDSIAESKNISYDSGTSVELQFALNRLNDRITYTVEMTNTGNGDAIVDNINVSDSNLDGDNTAFVSYSVEGISKGATISAGATVSFVVTATYESTGSNVGGTIDKNLIISLNYKNA